MNTPNEQSPSEFAIFVVVEPLPALGLMPGDRLILQKDAETRLVRSLPREAGELTDHSAGCSPQDSVTATRARRVLPWRYGHFAYWPVQSHHQEAYATPCPRSFIVSAALLAVLSACDSLSGPDRESFTLSLSGSSAITGEWRQVRVIGGWATVLTCWVTAEVRATGDGYADVRGGEIERIDPKFGQVDSELEMTGLIDALGSSRIEGGEQQAFTVASDATGPHPGIVRLRYEHGGEIRVYSHDYDCYAP